MLSVPQSCMGVSAEAADGLAQQRSRVMRVASSWHGALDASAVKDVDGNGWSASVIQPAVAADAAAMVDLPGLGCTAVDSGPSVSQQQPPPPPPLARCGCTSSCAVEMRSRRCCQHPARSDCCHRGAQDALTLPLDEQRRARLGESRELQGEEGRRLGTAVCLQHHHHCR